MALSWKYKNKIREIYFKDLSIEEVVESTGMDRFNVEKLLNTVMFRNHTDKEGIKWKKCLNCKVWRAREDNYHKRGMGVNAIQYDSKCKSCRNIMGHNERILSPYRTEKRKEYNKRCWEKNGKKYGEKKKVENLSEEQLIKVRARARAYYHKAVKKKRQSNQKGLTL